MRIFHECLGKHVSGDRDITHLLLRLQISQDDTEDDIPSRCKSGGIEKFNYLLVAKSVLRVLFVDLEFYLPEVLHP